MKESIMHNRNVLSRARLVTAARVLLLAVVFWQCPRSHAQAPLRSGSWNIELLGSPLRSQPQKAEDLARYIDFAKVDVLALQEIFPTGPAPADFGSPFATSKILDDVCAALNKMQGASWKHILFPSNDVPGDKRRQWVGLAWNGNKVQPLKQPVKLGVSNMPFPTPKSQDILWKRNVHAMMFTTGKETTDFILIPVHMKSNAGSGDLQSHREAEAKELVGRLSELDKAFPGEKDIIILGDTNFLRDKLKDTPPRIETARKVLQQANFKDLNADNNGTFIDGNAPFDRFFVPTNQPEFQQSSQSILRDFLKQQQLTEKEFIQAFSDHLMIVMEIQIMKDDD
jgi:hypothetical protein